jgi:hypothetical protein
MKSVYDDLSYRQVRDTLVAEYHLLRKQYDAPPTGADGR